MPWILVSRSRFCLSDIGRLPRPAVLPRLDCFLAVSYTHLDVYKRQAFGGDVYRYEGLEVDFSGRTVKIDGEEARLTPKEYDLLFYMVRNRNIALSRQKLLLDVWGYDFFGDDRTVDSHIKMLRANLGKYRDLIVTLRGMGYKFEDKRS